MFCIFNVFQSKQAITGDAVLLKFEKAKIALIDGLKRVEDIVPSSIGSQVIFTLFIAHCLIVMIKISSFVA